jgi:hypothetical protein
MLLKIKPSLRFGERIRFCFSVAILKKPDYLHWIQVSWGLFLGRENAAQVFNRPAMMCNNRVQTRLRPGREKQSRQFPVFKNGCIAPENLIPKNNLREMTDSTSYQTLLPSD